MDIMSNIPSLQGPGVTNPLQSQGAGPGQSGLLGFLNFIVSTVSGAEDGQKIEAPLPNIKDLAAKIAEVIKTSPKDHAALLQILQKLDPKADQDMVTLVTSLLQGAEKPVVDIKPSLLRDLSSSTALTAQLPASVQPEARRVTQTIKEILTQTLLQPLPAASVLATDTVLPPVDASVTVSDIVTPQTDKVADVETPAPAPAAPLARPATTPAITNDTQAAIERTIAALLSTGTLPAPQKPSLHQLAQVLNEIAPGTTADTNSKLAEIMSALQLTPAPIPEMAEMAEMAEMPDVPAPQDLEILNQLKEKFSALDLTNGDINKDVLVNFKQDVVTILQDNDVAPADIQKYLVTLAKFLKNEAPKAAAEPATVIKAEKAPEAPKVSVDAQVNKDAPVVHKVVADIKTLADILIIVAAGLPAAPEQVADAESLAKTAHALPVEETVDAKDGVETALAPVQEDAGAENIVKAPAAPVQKSVVSKTPVEIETAPSPITVKEDADKTVTKVITPPANAPLADADSPATPGAMPAVVDTNTPKVSASEKHAASAPQIVQDAAPKIQDVVEKLVAQPQKQEASARPAPEQQAQQQAAAPAPQSNATPAPKSVQAPAHPAFVNLLAGNNAGLENGSFGSQSFNNQNGQSMALGNRPIFAGEADAKNFANYMSAGRSVPAATTQMVALQIQRNIAAKMETFTLQLQPAELGRLDVRMKFDKDGNMKAHLTAERPETLAMLQKDQAQLQRTLQQAGIDVDDNSLSFDLRQQGQHQSFFETNDHGGKNGSAKISALPETAALQATIAVEAYGNISRGGINIMV